MTESHIAELATRLGRRDAIIQEPQAVERLSKDFYWYSPILKRLLDDKRADVIIQPQSVEEIRKIVSFSFAENIPVTVRDDSGNSLTTDILSFAANGDLAFTLGTDKYPQTQNRRGTIEFDAPMGVQIGVIGIRKPPVQTYTSLPALAK